jgi:hypothetical protein
MSEYFPPPCVFLVDVDQGLFLNPRTLRIGLPVQEHPRVRLGSVVTLKYTFVRAGEAVPIPEGAEIVADLMDRDPALAPRPFYSAPGLRLEEETGSVLVSYDLSSPNMAAMAAGPVWFSVRVNGSNCLTDRGTMETGSWSYPMPATPFQETEVSVAAGGTIALRPTPTFYTTDPVGADEPERVVPISAAALAEDTFYDCNRLLIKVLGEYGASLVFPGADRVDGVAWRAGWWLCRIRQYPDNTLVVEVGSAGGSDDPAKTYITANEVPLSAFIADVSNSDGDDETAYYHTVGGYIVGVRAYANDEAVLPERYDTKITYDDIADESTVWLSADEHARVASLTGGRAVIFIDKTYSIMSGEVPFSGAYEDLTGKPVIPTDLSDLSDETGILDAKEAVANKTQEIDAVTPSADKYTSEAAVVAYVEGAVTDALGDIDAVLDELIGGTP